MATNNATGRPMTRPAPQKGLLSGLVLGAEHMMLLGCAGMIVALVACGVVTWWTISGWWSTPADPEQQTVIVRRGEVEHSALDSCPANRTKFYTRNGSVCR